MVGAPRPSLDIAVPMVTFCARLQLWPMRACASTMMEP